MMKAWQEATYKCDADATVSVNSRGPVAHLKFRDQTYDMKQMDAADGSKYSSGQVTWTVHGENGILEEQSSPEKTVTLAEGCKLESKSTEEGQNAAEPAEVREPGTLRGTIAYLQRIAMPPNAVAVVTLQDTAAADTGAKNIAEERIPFGTRQVPIPFILKFDPAKIEPARSYSVRARIEVDGQTRFTTDKAPLVLTSGNPADGVNIILTPATP